MKLITVKSMKMKDFQVKKMAKQEKMANCRQEDLFALKMRRLGLAESTTLIGSLRIHPGIVIM